MWPGIEMPGHIVSCPYFRRGSVLRCFRNDRIVGHSHYGSLRFIFPLVLDVGRHQHGVPLGDGVILALADESGRAFQNEDHMLPRVVMPASGRVANRTRWHRVVV